MRLRTLLALMFSLLLAFTAALIGWRGYSNSRQEIKHFTQQEYAEANTFAAHHVVDFLDDPADRLLNEFTLRARRGMLKLEDGRALGLDLAERLRVNPTLAWISYSDAATGRFVGVWRTPRNDVMLNLNLPGPGHMQEMMIAPDGTLTPHVRKQPVSYDPRDFAWYKNAVATNGTAWSRPYQFVDGDHGITASRAWRVTDKSPVAGVFTVDFFLTDLQDMLDRLSNDFDMLFCALLEPDGTLVCSSRNPDSAALVKALGAWVRANPQFKDNGRVNGQINGHLVPIEVGPTEYLAALDRVQAASGLNCIVASMQTRGHIFHPLDHAAQQMFEIAMVALLIGAALGAFMAYRISEPLHHLEKDLARVGRFELAGGSRPGSLVHEMVQLHEAVDRMKTGLRSFIKYVPGDLVRQVLASGREAALGGEIRRLTVFLSDIEGFTTYSETLPPQELVQELAEYLEIVSSQLRRSAGEIDKFIGDGVLAFFNAPKEVARHEELACRATLAVLAELEAWRRTRGFATAFRTRIGLHCGEVLVGNIGTAERFAYTVLGDVVNCTSRLEGLNKIYGTSTLASREVRDKAGADFEWRQIDRVAVAGRKGGLEIHELLGERGKVAGERLARRDGYEQALRLYFARDFRAARELFAQVARDDGTDPAAAMMAARCAAFAGEPPDAEWDGVFAHGVK